MRLPNRSGLALSLTILRRIAQAALAAFAFCMSGTLAKADSGDIPFNLVQSPSDPVMLSNVWLSGYQYDKRPAILSCVSFTNTSSKPANAVQFRETVYDPYGARLGTFTAQTFGMFPPNVRIDGPVSKDAYLAQRGRNQNCNVAMFIWRDLARIDIAVAAVSYTDGTSWVAPQAATPADDSR